MLVNVNELGGNRLTIGELERLGVALAIYPMALMRLALGAAEQGLAALRASGSMAGLTAGMYGPEKLARLLDVASYEELVDEGDRR
jgi:methylisocitrate lyase